MSNQLLCAVLAFFFVLNPFAGAQEGGDLKSQVSAARAALQALETKKEFHALAALEAEWAKKIEKALQENPKATQRTEAWLLLTRLYGSAPDCGARIRSLYDRAFTEGASKPWFCDLIRTIFYQLNGKDRNALVNLLAHGSSSCPLPEAKAASLFYHGETLLSAGDLPGARKLFNRIVAEFPASSHKRGAEGNLREIDILQPGKPAPDFKIPKIGGGEIHLAGLRGKVVLLVFWTQWAPLLQDRAARLKSLNTRHKAGPFAMVGICLDEAQEEGAAQKTITDLGMTWAHGFDKQGWHSPVAGIYNVKSVPRAFLLEPGGKILGKDLLYKSVNLELMVNNAVTKRTAEIQKAEADRKKKEEADKKAAEQKKAAQPKK